MTPTDDKLRRELESLDPVRPGELDDAATGADATDLLARVLAVEVGSGERREGRLRRSGPGRRRRATPAFVALGAAAVAVAVVLIGLPETKQGRGDASLDGALDRAAAAAASATREVAYQPYTFLKTRELSVDTQGAGERTWSIDERTTREEWVGWDGSGRLRVSTAPVRFAEPGDRAEWEAAGREIAGSAGFVGLGSQRRTEDHWLTAGLLDPSVEELPTGAATLAATLREEARREPGEQPVAAAMLQRIADALRSPGASPELRRALYEATRRVPGIEYLGKRADPEGRRGIAVGVTGPYQGGLALFSLIFEPRTSKLLATETTSAGSGGSEGPTVVRALVYLDSRGTGATSRSGNTWVSDFEPATYWRRPTSPFLVYRVPDRNPWAQALDASYDEGVEH